MRTTQPMRTGAERGQQICQNCRQIEHRQVSEQSQSSHHHREPITEVTCAACMDKHVDEIQWTIFGVLCCVYIMLRSAT